MRAWSSKSSCWREASFGTAGDESGGGAGGGWAGEDAAVGFEDFACLCDEACAVGERCAEEECAVEVLDEVGLA